MNIAKINLIIFLVFIWQFSAHLLYAQDSRTVIDSLAKKLESLAAKNNGTSIYLRTNKDIYETMEDLWFKAYSVDQKHLLLSSNDKTLYVQLVQMETDSVVWEELYPIEGGISTGHIYLDNALREGAYWLCAYTSHSLNGESKRFIDGRKIKIIKSIKELEVQKKKTAIETPLQEIAEFNLFPEAGLLLAGVRNTVAFKATAREGDPINVSGNIYEDDKIIGSFKSIHDGMGRFQIIPTAGRSYSVRLESPYDKKSFSLPEVVREGMTFSLIANQEDSLAFQIYNVGRPQSFYLQVQNRGLPAVMASGEIKDSTVIKLPLTDVPAGISEATLFNDKIIPIAERLVYIKPNKLVIVTTEISNENAGKRNKLSLKIKAQDQHGKPVIAQLGAMVYDRLYNDPSDQKDIQTHFLISNQIRGKIHNPSYYFDASKSDRHQAMDLLLLTQGWRSYNWSESYLSDRNLKINEIIPEIVTGQLLHVKKEKVGSQQAIMLFDAHRRESQLVQVDNSHIFQISPENMLIGRDVYIKHFGKPEDMELKILDPFQQIRKIQPWKRIEYPFKSFRDTFIKDSTLPGLSNRSIKLEEVLISARQQKTFRDKYIGYLDSLAKYQNNTDRAHGAWLNCPAGDGDELPVEGKTYIIWDGPNPPNSHPFSFNSTNTKRIVYEFPKYSEAELMKMFGIVRTKGYYRHKAFYEPDYDKQQDSAPDYRNTLLWAPNIITDENGEATLQFYTSDINSLFYGLVEGISDDGSFGKSTFQFRVNP